MKIPAPVLTHYEFTTVCQGWPGLTQTEQGLCSADLSPQFCSRMQTAGCGDCLQLSVCWCHSMSQTAPVLVNTCNLLRGCLANIAKIPFLMKSQITAGELIIRGEQNKTQHQSGSACYGDMGLNRIVSGCHHFKTCRHSATKGTLCFISRDGE